MLEDAGVDKSWIIEVSGFKNGDGANDAQVLFDDADHLLVAHLCVRNMKWRTDNGWIWLSVAKTRAVPEDDEDEWLRELLTTVPRVAPEVPKLHKWDRSCSDPACAPAGPSPEPPPPQAKGCSDPARAFVGPSPVPPRVATRVPQFHSWDEVRNDEAFHRYTLSAASVLDDLAQIDNTDAAFNHALHRLLRCRQTHGIITFKVGIAADTAFRWDNAEYGGYLADGIWCEMVVVATGPANLCRRLEIDLISALRGVAGCYNVAPGGEGVSPEREHLCYVYIVIGRAGTGRSLKASAAQMQRPTATARYSGKGGKAVVDAKKGEGHGP